MGTPLAMGWNCETKPCPRVYQKPPLTCAIGNPPTGLKPTILKKNVKNLKDGRCLVMFQNEVL